MLNSYHLFQHKNVKVELRCLLHCMTKMFSCSAQMSMAFKLLNDIKMSTMLSRKNTLFVCFKKEIEKSFCQHLTCSSF